MIKLIIKIVYPSSIYFACKVIICLFFNPVLAVQETKNTVPECKYSSRLTVCCQVDVNISLCYFLVSKCVYVYRVLRYR